MPTTIDANVLPVHLVATEPCTSWSPAHSQPALFSTHDISDAYHHMHVDDAGIHSLTTTNPPPPYGIALSDPGHSSDDSSPDLIDDSSTDGYDSTGSDESVPVHTRYDVDSEIDECRLGDHPSPDSEDELWNAEFLSTPDQGTYLLSPAAWASWQLTNSVDDGNDHDNYQDAHEAQSQVTWSK